MEPRIIVRRVYEPASPEDGTRVLVDRLWPRGLSKAEAQVALWLKDAAPSTALRQWFGHKPERWDEFQNRYALELAANPEALQPLRDLLRKSPVTLLFGARDAQHNNAIALKAYLLKKKRAH